MEFPRGMRNDKFDSSFHQKVSPTQQPHFIQRNIHHHQNYTLYYDSTLIHLQTLLTEDADTGVFAVISDFSYRIRSKMHNHGFQRLLPENNRYIVQLDDPKERDVVTHRSKAIKNLEKLTMLSAKLQYVVDQRHFDGDFVVNHGSFQPVSEEMLENHRLLESYNGNAHIDVDVPQSPDGRVLPKVFISGSLSAEPISTWWKIHGKFAPEPQRINAIVVTYKDKTADLIKFVETSPKGSKRGLLMNAKYGGMLGANHEPFKLKASLYRAIKDSVSSQDRSSCRNWLGATDFAHRPRLSAPQAHHMPMPTNVIHPFWRSMLTARPKDLESMGIRLTHNHHVSSTSTFSQPTQDYLITSTHQKINQYRPHAIKRYANATFKSQGTSHKHFVLAPVPRNAKRRRLTESVTNTNPSVSKSRLFEQNGAEYLDSVIENAGQVETQIWNEANSIISTQRTPKRDPFRHFKTAPGTFGEIQEDDPHGWEDWIAFASPTKETLLSGYKLNNSSPAAMKGQYPKETAVIDENQEALANRLFEEICTNNARNVSSYNNQWETLIPTNQGLLNSATYQHGPSNFTVPSQQNLFSLPNQYTDEISAFLNDQVSQHQQERGMNDPDRLPQVEPYNSSLYNFKFPSQFAQDQSSRPYSTFTSQYNVLNWQNQSQQHLNSESIQVNSDLFKHASALLSLSRAGHNSQQDQPGNQIGIPETSCFSFQPTAFQLGPEQNQNYSDFSSLGTQPSNFTFDQQNLSTQQLWPSTYLPLETQLPTPITGTFSDLQSTFPLSEHSIHQQPHQPQPLPPNYQRY
jgi:hypothetical protein